MENLQWILLTFYLCVNCFFTGIEWVKSGCTIWFIFGFLFMIPMVVIQFSFYFIKLLLGKNI